MMRCVLAGFLEWVLDRVLPRAEQRAYAVSVVHRADLPYHGEPIRRPSLRRRRRTLTEHIRQQVRHTQARECTQVIANSIFRFYL